MTALAPNIPGSLNHRRIAGALAQALLVLLAAAALLWLVTQVPQRDWSPPPAIEVTLAGEHYRVAPEELQWIESFSTLHFSEGEEAAREIVAAKLDAELDRVFTHAEERLPAFADWYYSLQGEYTRAAKAALSYVNLADPGYVANQAATMLLPDDVWAEDIEGLTRETAASLQAHHSRVRAEWLDGLTRRLSAYRVPAPLEGAAGSKAGERAVMLDTLMQELLARESAALKTRLSISTLAAGGAAAGPALWRAATARSSALAGRTAAVRAAGRGAARIAPAAAGGAAICSPAGPAAIGCALFAGAAVWLATDWALLRVDEHLHREELVAALGTGLDELRAAVEQDLLAAYDEVISGHYEAAEHEIHRTFVPAAADRTP